MKEGGRDGVTEGYEGRIIFSACTAGVRVCVHTVCVCVCGRRIVSF